MSFINPNFTYPSIQFVLENSCRPGVYREQLCRAPTYNPIPTVLWVPGIGGGLSQVFISPVLPDERVRFPRCSLVLPQLGPARWGETPPNFANESDTEDEDENIIEESEEMRVPDEVIDGEDLSEPLANEADYAGVPVGPLEVEEPEESLVSPSTASPESPRQFSETATVSGRSPVTRLEGTTVNKR